MEITAQQPVLQAALDKAFAIAPKSSTTPILQNALLTATEDGLVVTATDSELVMVSPLSQVTVADPGSCVLPLRTQAIIRECPEGDVTLKVTGQEATITAGQSEWSLRLENPADFPEFDVAPGEAVYVLRAELLSALSRCRPPVATEGTRAMYQYMQLRGGRLRATDGIRLHQARLALALDLLLPARAVPEILRRGRGQIADDVEIAEAERFWCFRFDNDLLYVTKHLTDYPDVDKFMVTPSEANDVEVVANRGQLMAAVRRAALTADPDTSYMALTLDRDRLYLSAFDKAGNRSSEQVDVLWPHPQRELGVNHQALTDMLAALDGTEARFYLRTDQRNQPSPLVFREADFLGILVQLIPETVAPRRAAPTKQAAGVPA